MRIWPLDSLKKGIITTKFPKKENETISPWSTLPKRKNDEDVFCPADAIGTEGVDLKKCISCGLCDSSFEPSLKTDNYSMIRKEPALKKSFKIFAIDSGTCGSCNTELHSINNPYYDASRLGIFFTNTPKQADALAIMGVYSEKMVPVIKEAISAMSRPAVIILFGACPLSGNIFGKSLESIIEPDLVIGGCPPDPFVIIEALEKVRGRKQ
ncbi:MAG: NADH:ubiquinone oxidoreductase [Candidatus Thermoplasmatota archaeon]|nr:NADH:ubiquinone oxidoreductase [Candidatus Thermoplasmatota archaeon]